MITFRRCAWPVHCLNDFRLMRSEPEQVLRIIFLTVVWCSQFPSDHFILDVRGSSSRCGRHARRYTFR
jgi:hypothetical protein